MRHARAVNTQTHPLSPWPNTPRALTMHVYVHMCIWIQKHTKSVANGVFYKQNAPTPPSSVHPISQIHNWPSIMPEFICMVPAEVFTRCLWVSLTWLGRRSANLLGWCSGFSSIIRWIQEMLWNWWFFTGKPDVCVWKASCQRHTVCKHRLWHPVVPAER